MIDKTQNPAEIYLVPVFDGDHDHVWCDTPAPGEGMREEDATRYVREDIYLALQAQVEQLREDSLVAFGDGFYDGYLHYAKLCGDPEFTDDVMRQSELAEADSIYGKKVGSSVRVAEIKAQAGRDGFIAGLFSEIHNPSTVWNREERANEYANQLRQQAKKGE